MKAPLAANSDAVRYWHAKGYAVVSALRPGYGENTREDPEDHGVRWSGGTCNGQADFAKTTAAATLAMRSVHAWVVEQGWVAKNRILLVGQSVGGLTTVAACGQNWPGVMGCINFAGGAGGNPEASPAASCRPDAMEQQLASPGKSTTVPTLWLYSANDKFWGRRHPSSGTRPTGKRRQRRARRLKRSFSPLHPSGRTVTHCTVPAAASGPRWSPPGCTSMGSKRS